MRVEHFDDSSGHDNNLLVTKDCEYFWRAIIDADLMKHNAAVA